MKKLLLSVTLLMLSLISFSQLSIVEAKHENKVVVGNVTNIGTFVYEISYVANKDTTTTIQFKNMKYPSLTDIQSISFDGGVVVIDQLYTIIKSVISDEHKADKDYKVTLTLGKDLILISPYKMNGTYVAMVYLDKGYFFLWGKNLERLFGKIK